MITIRFETKKSFHDVGSAGDEAEGDALSLGGKKEMQHPLDYDDGAVILWRVGGEGCVIAEGDRKAEALLDGDRAGVS